MTGEKQSAESWADTVLCDRYRIEGLLGEGGMGAGCAGTDSSGLPTPASPPGTPAALSSSATAVEGPSQVRPIFKTWWFSTGAAVVVAGAASTGVLLAGSSNVPRDRVRRPRSLVVPRIPFLLAVLALSACKGKVIEQGVLVNVGNPSNVPAIIQLGVAVSNQGTTAMLRLPATPQSTEIAFPTSFSLNLSPSRSGRVDITIEALNSASAVVATGTSYAILQANTFVSTTVTLQPGGPRADAGSDDAGSADAGPAPTDAGALSDVLLATGGAGGTLGTGGAGDIGGMTGTAGTLAAGGVSGSGGVEALGGNVATGGTSGSGGTIDTGGADSSGGVAASGGLPGSGGIAGSGGVIGTGGTPAVSCGQPMSPAEGTVSAPALAVGSVATYACFSGYNLTGVATRKCQPDGTWDGAEPTCVPVNCGALAPPANGSVNASTTTFGATATYSCGFGYTILSSASRTCQADGTWSGSAPTCSPVDCGALAPPANGSVNAPATTYGSTATYSCGVGYTISSSPSRTCQADGTWSGSAPTCSPVDCGALVPPANGSVNAPATTYGSPATYSCDVGYTISSSASRTCQADGTWSGSAPTCTLVDCGPLTGPPNGSVALTTTTYGSTAIYSCGTEYTLSESVTRTCQANGSWSGSQPSCLPWAGMTCASTPDCPALTTCCDGSSQSCDGTNLPVGDGTNSGQFVVSADGLTVTDTITGLVWQRDFAESSTFCASGESCWARAKAYCASLVLGGLSGWRLPAVMEMSTIMDFTRFDPALDPTAFPNAGGDLLYTSTLWAGVTGVVWVIDPTTGFQYYEYETTPRMFRCVR
jgi:hypothetical protein